MSDDPDAADRVITAIFDRNSRASGVAPSGLPAPQSYFTPSALRPGVRIRHSVRARKNAVVRFGGVPLTPQPASDSRDLEKQRVTVGSRTRVVFRAPAAAALLPEFKLCGCLTDLGLLR